MHSERGGHIIGDASPYSPSSTSLPLTYPHPHPPQTVEVDNRVGPLVMSRSLQQPALFSVDIFPSGREPWAYTHTRTHTELGNGVS